MNAYPNKNNVSYFCVLEGQKSYANKNALCLSLKYNEDLTLFKIEIRSKKKKTLWLRKTGGLCCPHLVGSQCKSFTRELTRERTLQTFDFPTGLFLKEIMTSFESLKELAPRGGERGSSSYWPSKRLKCWIKL